MRCFVIVPPPITVPPSISLCSLPHSRSQWFSAGFFWDKDLLICHYGWESYSTVEDILAMAEDKIQEQEQEQGGGGGAGEAVDGVVAREPLAASTVDDGAAAAPAQASASAEEEAGEVLEAEEKAGIEEEEDDPVWEALVDAAFDAPDDPVWFYKDAQEREQGPFSTEQMDEWVQAGHFPGEQPLRHRDQEQFGFFKRVGQAFELPEEAEEDDVEADVEAREVAAAPSAAALLHRDGAAGEPSNGAVPEPVVSAETPAAEVNGVVPADAAPEPAVAGAEGEEEDEDEEDETAPVWTYRDKQGQHQGPFSTAQMLAWVEAGYMPEDTPVRHQDDPADEWSTIGAEFLAE